MATIVVAIITAIIMTGTTITALPLFRVTKTTVLAGFLTVFCHLVLDLHLLSSQIPVQTLGDSTKARFQLLDTNDSSSRFADAHKQKKTAEGVIARQQTANKGEDAV
eukprot:TRINITY_DN26576_c0_g1_i2.p2 TRINITY_DN26576_c0_g1~~TRINITY_DN26576_c0_g1_i2.p2  ORF type:complete len:107 (+),score=22.81 TRINITY_DN26576_c0_g1_i2:300-620(+)